MRIKQHEQNRYNTYTRTHTMVDLFNYKRQRAFNLKKQKRKKIIDLDHYPNNDYFNNTKNDLLAIKSRISMPLRIFLFYCMSYFFKLKEKRQVYFGIVVVLVCIFFSFCFFLVVSFSFHHLFKKWICSLLCVVLFHSHSHYMVSCVVYVINDNIFTDRPYGSGEEPKWHHRKCTRDVKTMRHPATTTTN